MLLATLWYCGMLATIDLAHWYLSMIRIYRSPMLAPPIMIIFTAIFSIFWNESTDWFYDCNHIQVWCRCVALKSLWHQPGVKYTIDIAHQIYIYTVHSVNFNCKNKQERIIQIQKVGMQSILKPVIGPKKEMHDLGGRVALITGGALGIGLASAIYSLLNWSNANIVYV